MLKGKDNREKVWNYLIDYGMTKEGAAGLMGNIRAESNFLPNNLEDRDNSALGMNDEQFTAAVDSGKYTRYQFIHDTAGYGLVQWTFWSLKQEFYDFWKSYKTKVSIGDLEMQLDFLMKQLSTSYPNIMKTLKTTRNVRTASDQVLMEFEKPGSVSNPYSSQAQATKNLRYSYSMEIYNAYAAGTTEKPGAGVDATDRYRVRKSADDEKSQLGAFSNLDNAKKMADSNPGYVVYDTVAKKVVYTGKIESVKPEDSKPGEFKQYQVKVEVDDLPIRTGPSGHYKKNGYTGKGIFTIVEEQGHFGKLLSGVGWINLKKVKKL